MTFLAISWQVTSIWIAGFVFAFLAVAAWAMFRSVPGLTNGRGPDTDGMAVDWAANHAEVLRGLEALRGEVGDLRSQVSDVQRLLREVG